jgi:hypothetical protein
MWFQGGQYEKDTRIDGKVVVITGKNFSSKKIENYFNIFFS